MRMQATAMGLWRVGGHAAQSGLGPVWVAQILDYLQYRVQYEARQMLLDQLVWSLIAFSLFSLGRAAIIGSLCLAILGEYMSVGHSLRQGTVYYLEHV